MIFGAIHAEVNWRIFFSPTGLPSTISYRHPVIELLTERPLQPLHTSVGLPICIASEGGAAWSDLMRGSSPLLMLFANVMSE
jgi:hypothetical protein